MRRGLRGRPEEVELLDRRILWTRDYVTPERERIADVLGVHVKRADEAFERDAFFRSFR